MNQYIRLYERFQDPTYAGVIYKDVKSVLLRREGLDARFNSG